MDEKDRDALERIVWYCERAYRGAGALRKRLAS